MKDLLDKFKKSLETKEENLLKEDIGGMVDLKPITKIETLNSPKADWENKFDAYLAEASKESLNPIVDNKVEKEMSKRFPLQKKESKKLEDFNDFDKVTITVYTQPKLTGIGKKAPDLMEVELNGKDNNEKIEWIKNNLSKEIKINEVFKEKIQVDIHGITRGRGYEGTTRRYNTPERQAKSEKHKRGVGSLGPWLPLVRHTVLFPSRWGSHLRTEHNKQLVKISNESDLVNPEGGFLKYGLVKNDYILVHGSVPGKANKLIVLSNAKRENKYMNMIDNVKYISKKSKQ